MLRIKGIDYENGKKTAVYIETLDGVQKFVSERHGRWEMRGGKRYCTHCGERACVTRDSDDFWYTVGTDWCPSCGAKMDGGNEK